MSSSAVFQLVRHERSAVPSPFGTSVHVNRCTHHRPKSCGATCDRSLFSAEIPLQKVAAFPIFTKIIHLTCSV